MTAKKVSDRYRPACCPRPGGGRTRGFTLVEMVMVITVTGILAAATSVFITGPVKAYFDTVRRAQLADSAETALRRIARDVESGLPNAVRVTTVGSQTFLEIVPVVQSAFYRSAADPGGGGPVLDFTVPLGTTFQVLGTFDAPASGQQVVVYNLGVPGSDVFAGDTRRAYASIAGSTLTYTGTGAQFPFASPSDRFYMVSTAMSYVCDTTAQTLTRYYGYAIQSAQPNNTTAAPLNAATAGILAQNVTQCAISYSQTLQHLNLVTISLTLTNSGDSVTFYQEIHVPNVP